FTPSYLSPEISALAADIKKANILFMGEMGLDPGIDHMTAMKAIHRIRKNGGAIIGFESLCGALVAPESDDNPWHYKISWSPGSLITAGKQGASYRKNRQRQTIPYEKLFGSYKLVDIPQLGQLAYYPNRDSERYAGLYQLEDVPFILRATLRHPDFCKGWQTIVNLGLTDTSKVIDTRNLTYKDWSVSLIEKSGTAEEKREIFDRDSLLHQQFYFLNLLNKQIISSGKKTAGALLLDLLSQKLSPGPEDKDMIVMLHRITFRKNNTVKTQNSLLITKGENNTETAIAKTVGLPLGILAKFLLNKKIHLTGLHIPTLPAIYLPVLEELEREGLRIIEYGDKVYPSNYSSARRAH